MTLYKSMCGVLLCIAISTTQVGADDLSLDPRQSTEVHLAAAIDALLPSMADDDLDVRQKAQRQWQEICYELGFPDREARRAAACRLMADKLATDSPIATRAWLLTQLERIGREECVEQVAKALDDASPQIREGARRALANNPASIAGVELRQRLQSAANNSQKIDLIRALEFRSEPESVAVLTVALRHDHNGVAEAAADALGKLGTHQAAQALATSRSDVAESVRLRVSLAQLRCADKQFAEGRIDEAAKVYHALASVEEGAGVRQAALRGTLRTAGDQTAETVLQFLASDDALVRAIAAGYVREMETSQLGTTAVGLSQLPSSGQIGLLAALGARRDRTALDAAVHAARSADDAIRIAALRALGGLADATTAPFLIETALQGGAVGDAALASLGDVFADGVDESILNALDRATEGDHRRKLLQLLVTRRTPRAIPSLVQGATSDDAETRRVCIAGLGRLGGADDIESIVHAMRDADDSDRDAFEKGIVAICQRIPKVEQRVDPVIALIQSADSAHKHDLLLLLGRLGGAKALQHIRQALASGDASQFDAGLAGLANWPDPTVADDLLHWARNAQEPAQRRRALRALARVAVLPGARSMVEKLELLKEAMTLANRDEERLLILERAAAVQHADAARFALAYLDDSPLAEQAAKTILSVAHRRNIRKPLQREFDEYLQRVINTVSDSKLVDRAKSYMTPWNGAEGDVVDRPAQTVERVNILLFTADDLHAESLGVYGGRPADVTPNLDAFAAEGMLFYRAHVNAAICAPCRAILATGRYSHRSGAMGFMNAREDVPDIVTTFQQSEYLAGILGKVAHSTPKRGMQWDFHFDQQELGNGRNPELYYQRTKAILEQCQHERRPFYLMVNSHDPHRPYCDPAKLTKGAAMPSRTFDPSDVEVPGFLPDLPGVRAELAQYLNSARRLDDTFGKVMQALKECGAADNTLVVFISDNGIAVPFAKCNAWYHSTRTPMLVRWPGVVRAGARCDREFVSTVDIFPTFVEAAGIDGPAGLDGRSFVPLLKGASQVDREFVFTQIDSKAGGDAVPMRCVQNERFAYIYNPFSDGSHRYRNANEGRTMAAMQTAAATNPEIAARIELFRYRVPEEFYDLASDPDCLRNLVDQAAYAEAMRTLQARLVDHMQRTDDPMLKAFLNKGSRPLVDKVLDDVYGPVKASERKASTRNR